MEESLAGADGALLQQPKTVSQVSQQPHRPHRPRDISAAPWLQNYHTYVKKARPHSRNTFNFYQLATVTAVIIYQKLQDLIIVVDTSATTMQTSTYSYEAQSLPDFAITTLQAECLRIAAERKLRRESRRDTPRLRRSLTHIIVLETLHERRRSLIARPPPTYDEATNNAETSHNEYADIPSAPHQIDSDNIPELDLNSDESPSSDSDSDGWSIDSEDDVYDDIENDGEHALVRTGSSQATTFINFTVDDGELVVPDSKAFDSTGWQDLISYATVEKFTRVSILPGVEVDA